MIQGQSLDGAFAEAQHVDADPSPESHIASYIALSRVKQLIGIYILQAFSPLLFTRGPPKGPHLLMKKLRREITHEEMLQ